MTVKEFCMRHTKVGELVVIRDCGYIVHEVWIDIEDIFVLSKKYAEKEVKKDEWGYLQITTEHGDKIMVPCHYLDVN